MNDVVSQRRHFAILLWRKPLQHRVARVDDEELAASVCNRPDEIADEPVVLVAIESESVLDRDWYRHGVAHRPDARGDELRLGHQARAEAAGLHALGRTADVQIDFVVTPAFAQRRTLRQRRRIAATQLQRDRMLGRIEVEMARHVTVQQRAGGHHLGVEPCAARDEAQEEPAVPVCPVHHRGDAQSVRFLLLCVNHLQISVRSRRWRVTIAADLSYLSAVFKWARHARHLDVPVRLALEARESLKHRGS